MREAYSYLPNYSIDSALADDQALVSEYSKHVRRDDSRLSSLLATEPAVSLHDHPFRYPVPLTTESWGKARLERRLVLGYAGLAGSGTGATVACTHSWCTRDEILTMLARLRVDVGHQEEFYIVDRAADIRRRFGESVDAQPVGVILGLESLTEFADDLDAVELLYGLGVRVAGLIYSEGNVLGCGLSQATDDGLTTQGRCYVRRMNDVGMAVDLAHVGDQSTLDAIEISTRPVMISHAGARGLWPTQRMKPDHVLKALASKGGVIGVEAAPNTTCSPNQQTHNIDGVMEHVEYLVELIGIDHVAFGPDLMFGNHAQIHALRSIGHAAPGSGEMRHAEYADGMENPNETFWNATAWLIDNGYGREEILKLTSRNALRVLDGALGYGGRG